VPSSPPSSGGRLLDGIRVLDAASFIAGPVATTVMADFGADVIKIEPPGGDVYRVRGPGYPASPYNFPWIVDNRNKRGVAIDLRTEAGQGVLHRLVRDADVFVTNLPLDARRRLRVTYEDLAPLNARLIYGSITAYGETGPEAGRLGFDSTALWARTALMDLLRPSPDAPPSRSLPGMGDHPTGMSLFGAIMAALYQRERTGRGGMVSTSLMANGLWWNAIQVQGILCGARTQPRPARGDSLSALANLYRCRDDRWFIVSLTADERRWEQFAACIGRADLVADPRFATPHARRAHTKALVEILDGVFAEKDWAQWRARFEASGIVFGVVGTLDDILGDEQMVASGALVPFDDPRAGATRTVSSPILIDGQDKVPPTLAPAVGEHTVDVLRATGYEEAEIERLLRAGVIAQADG
jgi:crotonobetainyl-CoA:carnitine CoA-transferase CaiB-like acyl-CoA transferase